MPFIKLEGFSGISPRTGPTQLAANQAQIARNVRVTSQELRSWKKEIKAYTPVLSPIKTVFRLSNIFSGAHKWLEWTTDVDIVHGPVSDLTENRIYYTGDGAPKKTNWALATTSGVGLAPYPNSWLYMGVPAPTGAPTLTPSSSATPAEVRAYVYTNISTFGTVKEESAPSPATTVTVSTTGSVTVSGFTAAPTTGYNITHRRIYRTITGSGSVTYSFVAEIPVATTSYVDSLTAVQLGEALTSLYYTPPPDDLAGIVAMANGILVGFRGNEVWFSEPYLPHAWPSIYMMTVSDTIVGLGVYDQSVVVLTVRRPYVISGSTPGAMSQIRLPMLQPCVSKRSIASDQFGVLYASPNGLVSIGSGTQDVVTTALYTREEWQALAPASMIGKVYNNLYIGSCNIDGKNTAIVLSRGDIPPLFILDFDIAAMYVDHENTDIYAISGVDNALYQLDADQVNNTFYQWKSKKFVMPNPINYAAIKVQAAYEYISDGEAYNALVAQITAANQALFSTAGGNLQSTLNAAPLNKFVLNGSILTPIPPMALTRSVNILVYADGVLVFNTGATSQEPIRMPVHNKAYNYEIEITGNVPVRSVVLATAVGELRNVNG